jgi:hypothetical protein
MMVGAWGLLVLSLVRDPLHPAWLERPVGAVCGLLAGVFLATLPAAEPWRRRVAAWVLGGREGLFRAGLFVVGSGLALLVAAEVFDKTPRIDDGISSIFQARIFLSGRLVLEPHPLWIFFEQHCVIGGRAETGTWCSMYPPGWPLLLVPGVALGAAWVVNPFLHGFLCVMTAVLGAEVYDRRTGRVAGLLCVTSPLLTVIGADVLSHTATALGLAVCAWAVLRLLGRGAVWYGVLAGAGWGFAFLCRPLTAVVVGAVIGLVVLVRWRSALKAWRGVLAAVVVAVAAFGVLAAWQALQTGDWRTPGHVAGMGRTGRMGFIRFDESRVHTPAAGWDFSLRRLRNLNHHLSAWPVPFFLIAMWPLLRGRAGWRELLLLLPVLGLIAVFSAFWYYERYYPSRYMTEGMPMLLLLAAATLTGASGVRMPRVVAWMLAAGGFGFMVAAGAPHLLGQFHKHYGDVEANLPQVIKAYGVTNAVVFMDQTGEGTDRVHPRNTYFGTGFMRNTLDVDDGDIVYARNWRELNPMLMWHFPGRSYYYYKFDRTYGLSRFYALTLDGTNTVARQLPSVGDFMY